MRMVGVSLMTLAPSGLMLRLHDQSTKCTRRESLLSHHCWPSVCDTLASCGRWKTMGPGLRPSDDSSDILKPEEGARLTHAPVTEAYHRESRSSED